MTTRWARKTLPEHLGLPLSTCQSHTELSRPSVLGFRTHERVERGMSDWRHLSKVQTGGEEKHETLLEDATCRDAGDWFTKSEKGVMVGNSPIFYDYETMQNGF